MIHHKEKHSHMKEIIKICLVQNVHALKDVTKNTIKYSKVCEKQQQHVYLMTRLLDLVSMIHILRYFTLYSIAIKIT